MTARGRTVIAFGLLVLAACQQAIAGQAPAPVSIEDLVAVADIGSLSLSPDGARLAFRVERAEIAGDRYRLDWFVADLAAGRVTHVADGGEPITADPGLIRPEKPVWAPDGGHFFHRRRVNGAIEIWQANADGSAARPAVTGAADVESVIPLGPKYLAYSIGPARHEIEAAEAREYAEGILVDASVDLAQPLFRGGLVEGRLASQRLTGNWFERAGLLWREPRRHFRLDLETLATEGIEAPPAGGPLMSTDGDEAALREAGGQTSIEVKAKGLAPLFTCPDDQCRDARPSAIAWRPGTRELIVTMKDRFLAEALYHWDIVSGRVELVARGEGRLSGARTGDAPCAIASTVAVCVEASAASPPRLVAIGLKDGQVTPLHDPNPLIRARPVPVPRKLRLEVDGVGPVTGQLFIPDGGPRNLPLFVTYYRCAGYLRGGEGDEWPLIVLAQAGIVSACINAPPVSGEQDGLASYRAAGKAVGTLVGRLAGEGLVDPGRVGMGGFSFGSEVTMWIAASSNLLRAASIASPQLEPGYYWLHAARGRSQPAVIERVWGLGRPDTTGERWRLLSPALNAERIGAALLMQLPEQEARLVTELHARLSNSTTPVELHAFPDEPHYKLQPRHKLAAYRRNLDWFRFWLQGYADPDPEKAGQYRRWDEMRRRQAAPSGK